MVQEEREEYSMRTLWHLFFGCPEGSLLTIDESLQCVMCGGKWWQDKYGKWVDHVEGY